ncbi:hypothetical protein BG006_010531 [Podila minutissima]|uniref:Uncharacterized protein n=1 Tax=Podila minutissima TaxID=64525 RepID=A0A9P5VIP4_9FUNG|nr:hypothetical protein BG006_010531 [Podila minutissima]
MTSATCLYTDCLSYYTDFLACTGGSETVTEAMLPCLCTPKVIGEYTICYPCLKANNTPNTTILTVEEYKDGCAKKDLNAHPYPTGYPTNYPTGNYPSGTASAPPGPSNTGTGDKDELNVGLYAGIAGGVAAVILIVGLIIYCRRKKPSNGKVKYAAVSSGAGAGGGAGATQQHGPPPLMQQVYPQNYSQQPYQQQYQQPYQQQYTPDQQQLQQQQLQQQQYQQQQYQQYEQQAQHTSVYAPPVSQPATSPYSANNQQGYFPTSITAPTTVPQPTPSPTFVPVATQYHPEAVASINNAQIYHANTSDYQNQQHVPLPGQNYQAQSSVHSPTIATNISSPTVVEQNMFKPVEASSATHQQELPKVKPGPQLYVHEAQHKVHSNNPQYIEPAAYH